MQPEPDKDFRELIVKDERPEVAACLVAVIDCARSNRSYSALRWDDDASDRATMQEGESNGRLIRQIGLTVQVRTPGPVLFAATRRSMELHSEQPDDGAVHVSVKSVAG